MTSTAESDAKDLRERLSAAAEQNRDAAKWMVASFAAVGAILVAGLSLSSLGGLEDADLLAAVVGASLAFVGVILAIIAVSRVLTAGLVVLASVRDPHKAPLGSRFMYKDLLNAVKQSPDLLGSYAADGLDTLLSDNSEPLDRIKELNRQLQVAKDDAEREGINARGKTEARRVERASAALSELLPRLSLRSVVYRFNRGLLWTVLAVVLIAAGLTIFAWASSRPEAALPEVVDVTESRTQLVSVALTAEGTERLTSVLGAGCGTSPVPALAIGQRDDALEVVALPRGGCDGYFFTLGDDLGAVEEACPIDAAPSSPTSVAAVPPYEISATPGITVGC